MIKTLFCVLVIIVLTFDAFSNNALLGFSDDESDKENIIAIEVCIIACLTLIL